MVSRLMKNHGTRTDIAISKLVTIISAFAMIRQALRPVAGENDFYKYPPHISLILVQFLMKLVIVLAGHKTTKEAEETSSIVARILVDSNSSETEDLKKFLVLIRTRNLKVQNSLFVLDWHLMLTVSLDLMTFHQLMTIYLNFLDNVHNRHLFSHNMPIRRLEAKNLKERERENYGDSI
jgi:hypothetical protein